MHVVYTLPDDDRQWSGTLVLSAAQFREWFLYIPHLPRCWNIKQTSNLHMQKLIISPMNNVRDRYLELHQLHKTCGYLPVRTAVISQRTQLAWYEQTELCFHSHCLTSCTQGSPAYPQGSLETSLEVAQYLSTQFTSITNFMSVGRISHRLKFYFQFTRRFAFLKISGVGP